MQLTSSHNHSKIMAKLQNKYTQNHQKTDVWKSDNYGILKNYVPPDG